MEAKFVSATCANRGRWALAATSAPLQRTRCRVPKRLANPIPNTVLFRRFETANRTGDGFSKNDRFVIVSGFFKI